MYGSPGNNRKQLEKFIVLIGAKKADLERKQRDLEVVLNDLEGVEDKCREVLQNFVNAEGVTKAN